MVESRMDAAVRTADQLLDELAGKPPSRELAPTMGRLGKVSYTHDAMIDLIVGNPTVSQNELAASFGYSVGWVSNIMASDAFQARLAQRKDELIDPVLRMTIEERFKGLVQRSLDVLMEKLSRPTSVIPDNLALQAAALGARGASLGGFGKEAPPAPPPTSDRLAQLAGRLVILQREVRTKVQNGQVIEGEVSQTVYDSGSAQGASGSEVAPGQPAQAAIRADPGDAG